MPFDPGFFEQAFPRILHEQLLPPQGNNLRWDTTTKQSQPHKASPMGTKQPSCTPVVSPPETTAHPRNLSVSNVPTPLIPFTFLISPTHNQPHFLGYRPPTVDSTGGTATNGEIKGSRVGVAAGSVRLTAGHPKAGTQTPRTTLMHPETRPSQTQTPGHP